MTARAATAEFIGDFGFEFVFGHARTAGAHGAQVAGRGDRGGAAHDVDFVLIFDETHGVECATQVDERCRGAATGTAQGADAVEGGDEALVPCGVEAEGVPDAGAVGDEFGQALVEFGDR